ncbi:hypothetical protein PSHT_00134 [Puccinia striiformis]|uniref:Secreted protein n=1 Tax=Puccinia striiformis TaxID=27350 RepID=A0A2S4WP32_9BASI|nr:hypothetical protein PSHT_00134 [Puccinia striiformis]
MFSFSNGIVTIAIVVIVQLLQTGTMASPTPQGFVNTPNGPVPVVYTNAVPLNGPQPLYPVVSFHSGSLASSAPTNFLISFSPRKQQQFNGPPVRFY